MAAAIPMSGAPRTCSVRIASAIAAALSRSRSMWASGSARWSTMRTAPLRVQAMAWTGMRSKLRGEWGVGSGTSRCAAQVRSAPERTTPHSPRLGIGFWPMNYETLLFDVRDGIAFVTINRPDKLNALNDQVMADLAAVAERVATGDDIRGAILTGAGPKAFVAGADIGDLARQGPFDGKARALRGQAVLRRLETCGKPVIAAVNGFALGGGGELARACPLRIASEHAKFGQPEVKLGIAPGYGGGPRPPRPVGQGGAFQRSPTGQAIRARGAPRFEGR